MPSLMLCVLQHMQFILFTLLIVFYATITLAPETGVAATRVVRRATSAAIRSVSINGTSSISSNNKIAKAGCKDRCGNISIPYPFGMDTSNCYRDYQFEIKCNYSNNPPIATIGGSWTFGNIYKVTEVTLDYVRIDTQVPAICDYDNITSTSSKMLDLTTNLSDISRSETPFTISNTLNKLTVLGCNIYGFVTPVDDFRIGSYDRSQDNNPIKNIPSSGCASICTYGYIGIPSPCVGSGCCKATIPNGLARFKLQVTRMIGHNMEPFFSPSTEPCIHAFVADHNFTVVGDMILSRDDIFVPLILEWAVKDFDTCSKLHSGYACGKNTDCVEFHNGPGYRCKCSKGYQGNPYLQHGCQDIDECKEPHKCGSEALCINTPGSYNCSCSPGKKLGISNLGYHCTPDKRRLPVAALVASGIGVTIIVILMLGIGYWLYKRFEKRKQMKLKQKHFERNGGLLLKQKITSNDGKVEKAAKIFVTEELEKATDNFNPSRIIGKGGFGTVYKGMLSGGEIVAIKKSTLVDEKQVGQFINEVVILSQINHRHIVKLLGCCLETQVPLLVYEFVPNGTLSNHLQVEQEDSESLLSWKDRVRIASEIAGALAYLHSDASVPVFHRDIKSNNILLDEKYKAKVSDFGISRSIPIDKTHLTTLVQGTFGYLDPQYFHSCQFTDKSDVYSFGVVLVELLTGEQAISQIRHEEEKGLALYFITSMKQNRLSETLDARVLNEGEKDDVLLVARLAKRCLKYVGKKRPTMKEVSLGLGALQEKLLRDSLHRSIT